MTEPVITLRDISKEFTFSKRKGLFSASKTKKTVRAVDGVSFTVQKGESLAFIGPNGAGKSTTIKMLCGILQPSGGSVQVLGFDPLKQRRQLALHIGTVFGQRSQLVFNLPLVDSFRLSAEMYRVPPHKIEHRIQELIEQFDLAGFADQPVRKLSLGQRMRAEIANSLIHNPEIIFLDEPTIGLDVVAKRSLRKLIRQINKELGTTIFLTSHDIGDIEEVCERTIVINHGKIILDASTEHLKRDFIKSKTVHVLPADGAPVPHSVRGIKGVVGDDGIISFSLDTHQHELKEFLKAILDEIDVADLTIDNTPLEDIIHDLYTDAEA
jgi:ABC-2 type transport system ATP-binding protein